MTRLSVFPKLRFVPLLAAGLLAACAPRPGAESAPAGNASTPPTSARNVTFAVENGYVPFNFIRPDTRAAEGWDYDVAAELYGLTGSACLPPLQTADTAGGYRRLRSLPPPGMVSPEPAYAALPAPPPARIPAPFPPAQPGDPLASPLNLPPPASAGDPAVPAEGTPTRPRIDPRNWRVNRGG